jgi:hypothetical protein
MFIAPIFTDLQLLFGSVVISLPRYIACFSIGWDYRDCHRLPVSHYEQTRVGRKQHLDMLLTRRQREKLLLEWEIPQQDIAEGTRTVVRIKNQRKQTVVNSGKVAKLEQAIEAASRRVSRALHLRKGTDNKVKKLQEQADRAAAALQKMKNEYEREAEDSEAMAASSASASGSSNHPLVVEPDIDVLKTMDMIQYSSGRAIESVETTEVSDSGASDDFTIGATTLGSNSYTQSMLEVENFYRELELELFGEEEAIPSMVGQTLEVPAIAMIGDQESHYYKPYNDALIYDKDCISVASSLPSIPEGDSLPLNSSEFLDQFRSHQHAQSFIPTSGREVPDCCYGVEDFKAGYVSMGGRYSSKTEGIGSCHRSDNALAPRFTSYECEPDRLIQHIQSSPNRSVRHRSPFELHAHHTRQARYSLVPMGVTGTHYNSSWQVPTLPMDSYCGDGRRGTSVTGADSLAHLSSSWRKKHETDHHFAPTSSSSEDQGCFDEPQIRHMPFHSHLSPNQWMGECDGPQSYFNATVTISEEEHNVFPSLTNDR